MNECIVKKCKVCNRANECFKECNHEYIEIATEGEYMLYRCSKCNIELMLNARNACVECIFKCKGKVRDIGKEIKGYTRICSKYVGHDS